MSMQHDDGDDDDHDDDDDYDDEFLPDTRQFAPDGLTDDLQCVTRPSMGGRHNNVT